MLTQYYVNYLFEYRDDGNLYWKVSRSNCIRVGSIAGSIITPKGKNTSYRRVSIDGKSYMCHCVIWLYVYGLWPNLQVDHKDGDGLNNRIDNLRESTNKQNQYNTSKRKNNKSGFKGVFYHKRDNRFRAVIYQDGKPKHLGTFLTAEEASCAYHIAAKKLHGAFYKFP